MLAAFRHFTRLYVFTRQLWTVLRLEYKREVCLNSCRRRNQKGILLFLVFFFLSLSTQRAIYYTQNCFVGRGGVAFTSVNVYTASLLICLSASSSALLFSNSKFMSIPSVTSSFHNPSLPLSCSNLLQQAKPPMPRGWAWSWCPAPIQLIQWRGITKGKK